MVPDRAHSTAAPTRGYALALGALTVLTALRWPAIWYGYPFAGHVDEPYLVDHAFAIARTGDLNPHRFYYPSLTYYVLAALYRVAAWLGALPLDSAQPAPGHFVLARGLGMALALGVVPVTAELTRRAVGAERAGQVAGLSAGLFAAASPLLTGYSFLATVNAPMAFWSVLAALPALAILGGDGRARTRVAAAVLGGLALGTKYVAFPVALLGAWAHLAGPGAGPGPRRLRAAALHALGVAAVFLATTPWMVLDHAAFRADVEHIGETYRTGGLWYLHEGAAGFSYPELAASLTRRALGPAALALAAVGALGLAWRGLGRAGWRTAVLLALVPAVSYLWLGSFKVFFARNALTAVPFLASLAGLGVGLLWRGVAARAPGAGWLAAAVALAAAWAPARDSLGDVRRALLVDTRSAALEWVRDHVPPGARIVREFNTPPLEELPGFADDHEVLYVRSIVQPDLRAECEAYDYVLVTWAYRRVLTEVGQRSPLVQAYAEFFARHELAAEFPADGKRYAGETIGIVRVRH